MKERIVVPVGCLVSKYSETISWNIVKNRTSENIWTYLPILYGQENWLTSYEGMFEVFEAWFRIHAALIIVKAHIINEIGSTGGLTEYPLLVTNGTSERHSWLKYDLISELSDKNNNVNVK